ncbi:unnamed protein product [Clonostachys rhizophaga]|uniref:Prion-inhibition and propagation HeLo domain-containing protein n=1 Tax=Clonostachys rhizophaga TaxID=160324 RepID=A0A9N9VHF1_9HYPO|nr:unnamed protein product [Clonostachys rhizophaga]
MAEAAGLAVGVIGLVGLTSSIIQMVQLVSSLDDFEDDYQIAGAMLTFTAARFTQWEKGAFPQGEGSVRQIPNVEGAQKFLEVIDRRFKDACQLLRTHSDESTEPPADTTATRSDRLRHIFKPLFRSTRFGHTAKRARWIVTDCDRLRRICNELTVVIEHLEVLVPTTSANTGEVTRRADALKLQARRDFEQLAEVARVYNPHLFQEIEINRQLVAEGHVDITGARIGDHSKISIGTRITEAAAKRGFTDRSWINARDMRVGKNSDVQAGLQVT